ncbi:oligosaccharide flippase family protein [bacterium]|nr:oligosaccharide flippase family protein [bacterium]
MLQNAFFSVFSKAQGAIFSYIITRLLLHAMAVEEYGFYSVLFVGIMLNLPYFARLGIPNFLLRFIPELYSKSRFRTINRLFHNVNLLQIGAAFLLLMAAFIFAPNIAVLIKFPGTETALRIFSIGALAYLVQDNIRTLLSGLFKQRIIFWILFYYNCVRLVAILYVTQFAYSIIAIIVAEVAAFLVGLVFYAVGYRWTIRPLIAQDHNQIEHIEWRRFSRYTGLSYLSEIAGALLAAATDLFLVTGILGAVAVGYYGIANRITTMMSHLLPYQNLRWVIEPLFFSEYGSSKDNSAQFGYTLLVKATCFITFPIGIWLALMAKPVIVHLFDPDYVQAAGILSIMALFLPMVALQQPLGLILQNAERIDLLIYSKVAGVIKIVVGLWLVPRGGAIAMVWIAGLAYLLQNTLFYIFTVTKLGIRTDLIGLLRLAINSALTAFLFLQIRDVFTGVGGIFLSVPCFAVIFLGLNLLHKTFRQKERDFINSRLRYSLWKF